ncbi:Uncharacterized protein Fot_36448 [Forsythia ovata]|uniref:ZF-HD dimerization-type domain-containing protein n=1 Tax=Forsythia ovata TaxID=205694 RepID=A0ABD1SPF0_9LAMI
MRDKTVSYAECHKIHSDLYGKGGGYQEFMASEGEDELERAIYGWYWKVEEYAPVKFNVTGIISLVGYSVDGCEEFMPNGSEALNCAVCGHWNEVIRKEIPISPDDRGGIHNYTEDNTDNSHKHGSRLMRVKTDDCDEDNNSKENCFTQKDKGNNSPIPFGGVNDENGEINQLESKANAIDCDHKSAVRTNNWYTIQDPQKAVHNTGQVWVWMELLCGFILPYSNKYWRWRDKQAE